MGQPTIQPSFAAGELSPGLYARVDLAKFHVGLALARNFFIDYRGGASNRPGTMAVGRCKQPVGPNPPRNIPFTFSTLQTYNLEFGGVSVVGAVTGAASNGFSVIKLTVSTTHLATGDVMTVSGVTGTVEANGQWIITVVDSTHAILNGSNFVNAYISGGTTSVTKTVNLAPAVTGASPIAFSNLIALAVASTTGMATGDKVVVSGVKGTYEANGTWSIIVVDGTHLILQGSSYTHAYVSGGVVKETKILTYTPTISGAVGVAQGLVRLTIGSTAGLVSGVPIVIAGVGGTVEANGTWNVSVIDGTHIDLLGSLFTNAYTSGGTYDSEIGYMRVIMDGGYVLEPSIAISAISQANPGHFTITAHGYSVGDQIYIAGATGMVQVNSTTGFQMLVATVVDANNVTFTDLDGNAINTASFPAYTGGGTAARVFTLVTPYAVTDLPLLKYAQSADVMTLNHPDYSPQYLTRSNHWVWMISPVINGPALVPPTGVTAVPSVAGSTGYSYVVTAVASNGGSESEPSTAATAMSGAMSANSGDRVTVAWNAIAGAQLYNVYRQYEIIGTTPDAGQLFGFVGSTVSTTFIDANILPDLSHTPPQNYNPFANGNNPSCSTYYQQRQVFAALANSPETLVFSKTGDYNNFDFSLPAQSSDSIVGTIASTQVNAVKFMVPMNSLIVLSGSGAWKVDSSGQIGGGFAPITPTSAVAAPQAYNGCADVPPIVVNYDILYVQAKGSIVRDLTYNLYVNVYTGTDVTILSNHLFFGHQILEWAYAEEPFKLIWCVRDDGVLLTFTFLKEQDVYAWAHHDTAGKFRSVASISEGNENAVYFIVERILNGKHVYMQERLQTRNMDAVPEYGLPADLAKAWFLDCALQYPLTYPAADLTPAAVTGTPGIVGVNVINGGSGYTAPLVTDVGGSGATFVVNLSGGVIASVSPLTPGTVTGEVILEVFDATGSGASLAGIVSNDVVMTADAAVFSGGMVGNIIRGAGGWGPIRVVNSTTSVTVDVQQPLRETWPLAAGAWSCTAPVETITGLDHLDNQTVTALANGNVVSGLTVNAGSVTLPEPADAILIGLPYQAQLQSLYADVPGESPTVQGKRIKISAVTLRVQDTRGLQVGHTFDQLSPFKERDFQPMGNPIVPITGDQRIVLDPLYVVHPQLCIQQDDPLPATVLGLIPELTVGDS